MNLLVFNLRSLVPLMQAFDYQQFNRYEEYAAFVKREGGNKWPEMPAVGMACCLSPPSEAHIETYASARFEQASHAVGSTET